ncbi:GDP-L-fucose synthase family protein [Pontiella sulfatireligans]|uniref:GDP-L-fucose synthase n=1 Tax=Pontiella sulfatireligans TaxID=2750658 RepID=A0A6C2UFE4_9BACT|nr:GDP-L-fucose synthase [Pontiella sulfatireligans]VGO18247.1 GDP-L-fucose synthase [Pontiella sulfatireligans]
MRCTTPNSKLSTLNPIPRDARIYVAGHRGLVGSGIWRALERHGYTNLIGKSIDEVDLINQQSVEDFFAAEKPDYVVLVAAKVGGIVANSTYRGQFIYENLMIEMNVIHAAKVHGVKKLLFLGSSCIYPKLAPQPMKEEHLLTGPLEPTNEPYAIAKIAGIRLCDAYNRQYGTNFISAMPTNMYGPGDNYHPENSHVLPAFIRRMHLAKALMDEDWVGLKKVYSREKAQKKDLVLQSSDTKPQTPNQTELLDWLGKSGIQQLPASEATDNVHEHIKTNGLGSTPDSKLQTALKCWGSGSPLREFLYSDDLAEACVFLLENISYADLAFEDDSGTVQSHVNVGSGAEVTIKELAETVKEVVGYEGEIEWDAAKPDGTPRKLMDSSRLISKGWSPQIDMREGIALAYKDFLSRYA